MTLKQYDELQRVAQYGAFITLREGARHMVERAKAGDRGGSLIATGSLTNFTATPGIGHYAAAKRAVAGAHAHARARARRCTGSARTWYARDSPRPRWCRSTTSTRSAESAIAKIPARPDGGPRGDRGRRQSIC